jgi:hypothetical protein
MSYPLNREQSILAGGSTNDRHDAYAGNSPADTHLRENNVSLGFSHSNTEGPYMEITSGYQAKALAQYSGGTVASDYEYQNYSAQLTGYLPLGDEKVVMANIFGGESFGRNAVTFRLGGVDRVRGLSDEVKEPGVMVANLELRLPLSYNLNYHAWYIFPDLYFKSMYGVVFADCGYGLPNNNQLADFNERSCYASYGVGLRMDTFIIETFPLLIKFDFAKRIDAEAGAIYISFGSSY